MSTPLIVGFFPATQEVADGAIDYLTVSWWGLPGMLIVIAATGMLRGLQNTKTPLYIAAAGFTANAALNALLIYGLGLGLVGSAIGTIIAQWAMAAVFLVLVGKEAVTHDARVRPGLTGLRQAAVSGSWLLVRTLSLRIALVATVLVATSLGTRELAAWHIIFILFSLLALALDALAIAGQALVGHDLGAGNHGSIRNMTSRLVRWGFMAGGVLATVTGLLSPLIPLVMTSDTLIREALWPVLVLLAMTLPLAAFVFVLDGVLIGAGDGRYLAFTGVLNLAMFAPLLWLASLVSGQSESLNLAGLLALEAAFGIGYIGARALTLGLRHRGDAWMVIGDKN
jgi:putative MATE family efflux protein